MLSIPPRPAMPAELKSTSSFFLLLFIPFRNPKYFTLNIFFVFFEEERRVAKKKKKKKKEKKKK